MEIRKIRLDDDNLSEFAEKMDYECLNMRLVLEKIPHLTPITEGDQNGQLVAFCSGGGDSEDEQYYDLSDTGLIKPINSIVKKVEESKDIIGILRESITEESTLVAIDRGSIVGIVTLTNIGEMTYNELHGLLAPLNAYNHPDSEIEEHFIAHLRTIGYDTRGLSPADVAKLQPIFDVEFERCSTEWFPDILCLPKHTYLGQNLFVAPEYREKGVAKELLDGALKEFDPNMLFWFAYADNTSSDPSFTTVGDTDLFETIGGQKLLRFGPEPTFRYETMTMYGRKKTPDHLMGLCGHYNNPDSEVRIGAASSNPPSRGPNIFVPCTSKHWNK